MYTSSQHASQNWAIVVCNGVITFEPATCSQWWSNSGPLMAKLFRISTNGPIPEIRCNTRNGLPLLVPFWTISGKTKVASQQWFMCGKTELTHFWCYSTVPLQYDLRQNRSGKPEMIHAWQNWTGPLPDLHHWPISVWSPAKQKWLARNDSCMAKLSWPTSRFTPLAHLSLISGKTEVASQKWFMYGET